VNLSAVIEEMALLLRTVVAGTASLTLDCPAGLPLIEADPLQLRQVILNLVTNASEALLGRRGEVRVRTGARHLAGADLESPFATDLKPGLYAFVEVSDTGCGMDAATLEKVFDPFFTTKFTGRGLGLAAVLGIVRAHRGLVQVRSTPGTGTTFGVFFPVIRPSPTEADARAEGAPAGTILLVEDERNVRELARVLLEQFGYRVVTADDGQAGLEEFDRLGGQVDVVLLDLTMPRQSGLQVLATLRQRAPQLPVVLMTGYSTETLANQANDPWTRLVQKPFSAETLFEAIAAAKRGDKAPPG
jgi:CheY-like chemotaxis protein